MRCALCPTRVLFIPRAPERLQAHRDQAEIRTLRRRRRAGKIGSIANRGVAEKREVWEASNVALLLRQFVRSGATEVFADFNFDLSMVGPDTDPSASMDLMEQALEVFAPTGVPLPAAA